MDRQTRRAILILVFSEFLVCLGISLVIPVMPFIKNERAIRIGTICGLTHYWPGFRQSWSQARINGRASLIYGLGSTICANQPAVGL